MLSHGVSPLNFLLLCSRLHDRSHSQRVDPSLDDVAECNQEFKVDGAGYLCFCTGDAIRADH